MAASVVLPKASDAREAYEQGQNIQTTEDWNNAAKQILADQTNNKTSSHLPWTVSLETRKELERLGYSVVYGNQYNEAYTNISW